MIQATVEEDSARGPFTFAAVWHVKRESLVQFEALLQKIVAAAAVFPGHEGVHAVTPAASSPPVYRVVVRFASEKTVPLLAAVRCLSRTDREGVEAGYVSG